MLENTLVSDVVAAHATLVTKWRETRADGAVTVPEIMQLSMSATDLAMAVVKVAEIPGADKKAIVMEAADVFFHRYVATVDIKWVPGYAEAMIYSTVRPIYLKAVDGAIEWIYQMLYQVPEIVIAPADVPVA